MQEGHFYNEYDLIEACKKGHIDVVREILRDKRVSREADNSACLYWACHNGHAEVVCELLWDDEADASADESGALCAAAEFGYADIVRMLIEHRVADPAARCNSAIIRACRQGHADVVWELLQSPCVDPAVNEGLCLYWACRRGHVDVAQLLMEDGRVLVLQRSPHEPVFLPYEAYDVACKKNYTDIVKLFLDHDYVSTYDAMCDACRHGHVDLLQAIFDHPVASSRITSFIFKHAIRVACNYDHVDLVRTMIARPESSHAMDPYIRRWIDTNIVTHPGSWLHGKYVERAHAIAWSLRQMGQSDLVWDFVPYFMNARIQPVENWKEYMTQSPSCSLLPLFVVGICCVIGLCVMIVVMRAPPKRIQ